MSKGIIAIDADGVMLDYNLAFKDAYEKAFSTLLSLHDEKAFHAKNMWGISDFESEQKAHFYKASDSYQIWKNMPAIKDSVDAVNKMVQLGYEVVCVTSMPPKYQEDRLYNLQTLGFKISKVIATNRVSDENPKKKYIEELKPLYFIDDLLKNFEGIKGDTELVYVEREYSDNPNKDYRHIPFHHTVSSLKEFSNFLVKKELAHEANYEWDNWLPRDEGISSFFKNKK